MDGFLSDLAGCKAIIANAGFSLVSEALHLGKPYLAVPVKNQFEQIFNAYYLDQTGYGAWWKELNKERVESFLFNLPQYAETLASYPRQGNTALLAKVDELIAEFTAKPLNGAKAGSSS
jgi:UDP:flavonoid glycosyltransferase YjiC (YdhE family)